MRGNDMTEINQDFADGVLHSRNPETNKNDYGRILCVCGSFLTVIISITI